MNKEEHLKYEKLLNKANQVISINNEILMIESILQKVISLNCEIISVVTSEFIPENAQDEFITESNSSTGTFINRLTKEIRDRKYDIINLYNER